MSSTTTTPASAAAPAAVYVLTPVPAAAVPVSATPTTSPTAVPVPAAPAAAPARHSRPRYVKDAEEFRILPRPNGKEFRSILNLLKGKNNWLYNLPEYPEEDQPFTFQKREISYPEPIEIESLIIDEDHPLKKGFYNVTLSFRVGDRKQGYLVILTQASVPPAVALEMLLKARDYDDIPQYDQHPLVEAFVLADGGEFASIEVPEANWQIEVEFQKEDFDEDVNNYTCFQITGEVQGKIWESMLMTLLLFICNESAVPPETQNVLYGWYNISFRGEEPANWARESFLVSLKRLPQLGFDRYNQEAPIPKKVRKVFDTLNME